MMLPFPNTFPDVLDYWLGCPIMPPFHGTFPDAFNNFLGCPMTPLFPITFPDALNNWLGCPMMPPIPNTFCYAYKDLFCAEKMPPFPDPLHWGTLYPYPVSPFWLCIVLYFLSMALKHYLTTFLQQGYLSIGTGCFGIFSFQDWQSFLH